MIRIYYNPTNGSIVASVNAKNASSRMGNNWIDIAEEIKINEWRVDLSTQQLVKLPDDEIVQQITRNF